MIDLSGEQQYILVRDRGSACPTKWHFTVMTSEDFARLQALQDERARAATDTGSKPGDPGLRGAVMQQQNEIISTYITKIEDVVLTRGGPPETVTERDQIAAIVRKVAALDYDELTTALMRSQVISELAGKASGSPS